MSAGDIFTADYLNQNGLNIQAVFDIKNLPQELKKSLSKDCSDSDKYTQLILIGNGGKLFWDALKDSKNKSKNPVDDFSAAVVSHWLDTLAADIPRKLIYPPSCNLDLQKLGQLAGWHHPSPFMVGINNEWGTWFAYRAVILAGTNFELTSNQLESSPCKTCTDKPCISHCPAKAVTETAFDLNYCINYRKQENSACQTTCQSRISCPVATEHQYSDEQIHYHYSRSFQAILKYT